MDFGRSCHSTEGLARIEVAWVCFGDFRRKRALSGLSSDWGSGIQQMFYLWKRFGRSSILRLQMRVFISICHSLLCKIILNY